MAPLLICIAALAMAFHHWRRYPILQEAINLKRPYWLALFISCGIGAISFGGAFGLDHISKYFPRSGPPNMFDGPFDGLIMFLLLPLTLIAIVCSFIAAVWCLCRLIAALLS
ncbi:MAG TPA: hypothetical protein VIK28_03675, partial [Sedimentisphaerales bacterium]